MREYERERKTPSWHDKWPRQLAAYATALGDEMFRADRIEELMGDSLPENHRARKFIGREMPGVCVSLVINTNEDHPNYQGPDHPGVWIRKWKREVIDHSQDVMEEVARLFYTHQQVSATGERETREAISGDGRLGMSKSSTGRPPERNVVAKRVEDALGNRQDNLPGMRSKAAFLFGQVPCNVVGADLGRQCEGFRTIEAVRKPIAKEVYKL